MPDPTREQLRAEIKRLTAEYHRVAFAKGAFRPGEDSVPVSGMVFDADEMEHLVDASLDFWLTTGRYADQFERRISSIRWRPGMLTRELGVERKSLRAHRARRRRSSAIVACRPATKSLRLPPASP